MNSSDGSEGDPSVHPAGDQPTTSSRARARFVEEAALWALFEATDEGFCVVEVLFDGEGSPADFRFVAVNSVFEEQTGLGDPVGESMKRLRPDHEDHWFEIYGEIARTGEPRRFQAEAAALNRWYCVNAFRVGPEGENLVGILFRDISQRKEAERQRETAIRELEHRVQNTLATVEAIAERSIRSSGSSMDDFAEAFRGRIRALSRVHRSLSEQSWDGITMTELVRLILTPHASPDRIRIDGEDVELSVATTLPLAMAFHELATNAVKYGALSVSEGELGVTWTSDDGLLQIEWREGGGPPVTEPEEEGYGMTLLKRGVPYELGGSVEFSFPRDGVRCRLEVPHPEVGDFPASPGAAVTDPGP